MKSNPHGWYTYHTVKVLCLGSSGSVAVIIPPLLFSSTSGSSLRTDLRKLEDKLESRKIELRLAVINMNTDDLHRNRECPSAYPIWLGVVDSTLPSKGTAHRALRGKDAEPNPERINVFLEKENLHVFGLTFGFPHIEKLKALKQPWNDFLQQPPKDELTQVLWL